MISSLWDGVYKRTHAANIIFSIDQFVVIFCNEDKTKLRNIPSLTKEHSRGGLYPDQIRGGGGH